MSIMSKSVRSTSGDLHVEIAGEVRLLNRGAHALTGSEPRAL